MMNITQVLHPIGLPVSYVIFYGILYTEQERKQKKNIYLRKPEALGSWIEAPRPFSRLHADFFYLDGNNFL